MVDKGFWDNLLFSPDNGENNNIYGRLLFALDRSELILHTEVFMFLIDIKIPISQFWIRKLNRVPHEAH